MKVFVTGAAGFIGSTLADRLLRDGHEVVGYDNFSTGQESFVRAALENPRYRLVRADVLDPASLTAAMAGVDLVVHLQANADVRFGTHHPERDLEQNTVGTFRVLEAMRSNRVRRIAFSSTGSVYGEHPVIPTPEDAPFPIQTSLYGASKVASEALIAAYAEGFGLSAAVFRFVSILGPRYTHGHVFDFYRQLREHPDRLHILGDGTQRKSYLHVDDCVQAILTVLDRPQEKFAVYNLGADEYCRVNDSVGWIGDNPFIFLDTRKIRSLGWAPAYSIEQGVRSTLRWLRDNPQIFEARA